MTQRRVRGGNRDSEVGVGSSDGIAEVFELELAVGAGVDQHDVATAAQHHLVKTEVFKVAAVRELDPLSLIVGPAQRLGEDGGDGEVGAGLSEVAISILVRLFV